MWDLNDSPYQQPRDDESEGCSSSQKTSVEGDEDKGKRVGSMLNSSSSALVVEDGSEEEDGERVKAGLKKRGSRIFYFSMPHEEEEEEEEECSMESEPDPVTRQFFPLDKDQETGSSSGYFNVIGSDPEGRLARGIILGLKVKGMDYKTHDETCIRDYIDVTDLVDAIVKSLQNAKPHKVGIYNVGAGRGRSVKDFVEACKKATRVKIKVDNLPCRPRDYAEVFSDPTKIRRELNWIARFTDLQESLQIAWRWQKAHRDGYTAAS
ncbi:putative UDP-arabinose 4-epimerase 3 [Hibiscus syriacus]|uniref:UDP-arabinose 4-epimerase 3 n=1 Tax=Hibiscus syriacus TaxID=106335 RepID=A0A6A3CY27_HIBSY|nr:putative UDP-arabinose 4-epimerase 3 [Hibiscus syriacus]